MDFEEIPKPPEHVVRYAMGLVSGPCIAMIILGFAVRVSEPPVLFVASMQHLAAGIIVLSAVAVELVPVITDAESTAGNIAGITLGFVFGVALFLIVGKFCEGDDDDDCDHGHDHSHEHAPPQRQLSRRKSLGQSKSKIGMMKQLSGMDGSAGKSYQAVAEAGTATIQGAPAYPTTMVLAVLVDAAVDGFLIGISAASGTNAGLIMAIVRVEILRGPS